MILQERIAKAIYESRNGHGCKPWTKLPIAHKAPYMADAQAALDATAGTVSAKARGLPELDRRFLEFIRDYPPNDMALWHFNGPHVSIPAELWPRLSKYVEIDPAGLVIFKLNEMGTKALEG